MGALQQFLNRLDLDTLDFSSIPDQEYKKQASHNWTQNPCGSNYSDKTEFTRKYFDHIEEHRYGTHPWLLKQIQSLDVQNKTVLEIGCGLGTDHLMLARNGGEMHAFDLGQRNLELTSHRLKIYGYSTNPVQGDGEYLPFADESLDFVYSFGVLHHLPDTKRAVSEIYRVLKPGGKCFIGVYNKKPIHSNSTSACSNTLMTIRI
jgi:ubiquinone/menaquinone biosynthesis C-methylase UbiE